MFIAMYVLAICIYLRTPTKVELLILLFSEMIKFKAFTES